MSDAIIEFYLMRMYVYRYKEGTGNQIEPESQLKYAYTNVSISFIIYLPH